MNYISRFCILILMLILAACATNDHMISNPLLRDSNTSSTNKNTLSAIPVIPGVAVGYILPVLQPGDSFTFDSPMSTWHVEKVENGVVYWSGENSGTQKTTLNPILPALEWESQEDGNGLRKIGAIKGMLFPLKKGNTISFETIVKSDHATGFAPFFWSCAVDDSQITTVPAGIFHTVKIRCERQGSGVWIFYYAPKIGFYIRMERTGTNGQKIVRRLVAYNRPSLGLYTHNDLQYATDDVNNEERIIPKAGHSVQLKKSIIDRGNRCLQTFQKKHIVFNMNKMYGVHIYSFKNSSKIIACYHDLLRNYHDVFMGNTLSLFIKHACVNNQHFYRLLIGPMSNKQAHITCRKIMHKRKTFCQVLSLKDAHKY